MQPLVSTSVFPTTGSANAQTLRCPLCQKTVTSDPLGFVECSCGWGGPEDPIESARGLSRKITLIDRRLAGALVRKDLARMAAGKWRPDDLGAPYTALLLLFSTFIYIIVGLLLVGSAALTVKYFLEGGWLGVAVMAIIFLITVTSLFTGRAKAEGETATRERFPALFAALDEVCAKVGAPFPTRVVLLPTAEAFIYQRRPVKRLFRREVVLALGVGALPLLSDVELKAILAHEMAHYGFGHIAFSPYYGRAEVALRNFIEVMLDAIGAHAGNRRRRYFTSIKASDGAGFAAIGVFVVWVVSLPLRLVLILFHLVRMGESRAAEFDVDRAAALAYGPRAFGNGLTGIQVASRTIRGSYSSLRAEMSKRGERNFYAQLRKHYSELPPNILYKLRIDGSREFRSLERTHPTTVDRLRAAYTVPFAPPAGQPFLAPAVALLTPIGEADASSVELALTQRLFDMAASQRQRRGGRRR